LQADTKKAARKAQREHWRRAAVAVISATRRDADISQEELAKRLGWSRAKLGSVESGRRKLAFEDFPMIALALGIDPEKLFSRVAKW